MQISYSSLATAPLQDLVCSGITQLKSIILGAPSTVRESFGILPRGKTQLLAIVLQLRDQRMAATNPSRDEAALRRVMDMTVDHLQTLADDDLPSLVEISRAALRADSNLQPREFDEADKGAVHAAMLQWKLRAAEAALRARLSPATPLPDNDSPPAPAPSNPLAGTVSERPIQEDAPCRRYKKRKVTTVGGVVVADDLESDNEDCEMPYFRSGLGAAPSVPLSHLKTYPGKANATDTLQVRTLMGPAILQALSQKGVNVEMTIRSHSWSRRDGQPYTAEIEALTWARVVHLNLLKYSTMGDALRDCPWMEVALRRLWTIMEIEKMCTGPNAVSREEAQTALVSAMEVYPSSNISVPEMEQTVRRHFSTQSRAANAIRNLSTRTKSRNQSSKGRQRDRNEKN